MSRPPVEAMKRFVAAEMCALCPSTIRKIRPGMSSRRLRQKSMNVDEFVVVSRREKYSFPRVDTAEIMFTVLRLPVPQTTGVAPTGAPVVPVWTEASSANRRLAPVAAASAGIAGYSS